MSETETSEAAREAAEQQLEHKNKIIALLKQARDRYVPCADHRDKVHAGDRCMVCRAEAAERERDDYQAESKARGDILDDLQSKAGATWWIGVGDAIAALREQLEDAQIRANDEASKAASVAKDHRRTLEELAEVTRERDEARDHFAVLSRAVGNWRTWPGEAESDHDHPDWQAASRALLERDEAQEEAAFFRREVTFQAERLMPEIHSLTEQLTAAQQRVERLTSHLNRVRKGCHLMSCECGCDEGEGYWQEHDDYCQVFIYGYLTAALTESEAP